MITTIEPTPHYGFMPHHMRGQKVSGVYKITSPSGKFYIGSAVNIRTRWKTHRKQLRGGIHHSVVLQRASEKHGLDNLIFQVLLVCEPCNLLMYEQRAMDVLKPQYNVSPTAGSKLGVKPSFQRNPR